MGDYWRRILTCAKCRSDNTICMAKTHTCRLHMAIMPGQQGRNSRPVRVIIGGQFAAWHIRAVMVSWNCFWLYRKTRQRGGATWASMQGLAERVMPTASLFFCINTRTHLIITLSGNPKAINLGGAGAGPRMRPQALQLLDMNGVAGSQTPPDSVQLAVSWSFRRRWFRRSPGCSSHWWNGAWALSCSPYADLLKMDSSSQEEVHPL